ncbi:integrase, catalytic region, zinc finger, CCHC-type containing protein [Tanacetum coccineum]|uniref:Integrase, catalytic region, zinc finger, CCHC-type containing protein n=1 Tax=Tanacetum coccineum TaxID=301880 RepID=A0ABQ5BZP2_9ASTR
MARQCTQLKRPRNAAWFNEKAMLAKALEAGQILDEEQLAFLADPGILNGQAVQTTIPNTIVFQTEDLNAYDYDCDDVSNAKVVLMANLSSYGSDVLSKVVQIVLWYLDSECSKQMTRNRSRLMNFISKFLGTVQFRNDQVTKIIGYGNYQLRNLMHDKKLDLSFLHVFGLLYYPTNDSEDLGKLNAKADIGIFVGYTPAKKAFRIYNKRTQKIMEIIHVTFDELMAMAFEQFDSGPELQSMTPATTSSGLVPNPIPQ